MIRLFAEHSRHYPTQLAWLSFSATLRRGKMLINPRLRAGPPSRSVPPPGIANHHRSHHIHQRRKLTFHLAQFLGSAHPTRRAACGWSAPWPSRSTRSGSTRTATWTWNCSANTWNTCSPLNPRPP